MEPQLSDHPDCSVSPSILRLGSVEALALGIFSGGALAFYAPSKMGWRVLVNWWPGWEGPVSTEMGSDFNGMGGFLLFRCLWWEMVRG